MSSQPLCSAGKQLEVAGSPRSDHSGVSSTSKKKKKGPPQLETHGETEALNGITSLVPVTYY